MMDIFFQDPTEVPLPPQDVRIQELRVEPWADGRRVRVHLLLTPFQKRPSLEVVIHNSTEDPVAQVSIIETMTRKLEFIMHLREEEPAGAYTARAVLYYEPAVDEKTVELEQKPEPVVVDRAEASFSV